MSKKTTVLTPEIKERILESKTLKIALFELWGVTQTRTIKTWLEEDNPRLTQVDSLKMISLYTGVGIDDLTTEVVKSTAL